jgi:DNA-binding IscR family transcriptional regulator
MADVVQIIEGDYNPVDCLDDGGNAPCPRDQPCPMRDIWREVRDSVTSVLARTTLQMLTERRRTALTFSI